ncbi:hypothetical protein EBR96_05460, partial [bacterium]|nr:hypothetical protein [bacterium]
MSNNQPRYSRTIKLSPAIGDWTRIADNQPTTSGLRVRSVVSTGFDSLPKEQLELAHYVHYRLGELIVQKLSSSMDIKVELHTVTALQMTYESFIQTYTSDVVQSDIVFPDGNRINVLTDWALADQVVNRLTGGTGESDGSQEFSEIEASILEAQLDELLTLLPIAWKNSWNNAPLNLDFN